MPKVRSTLLDLAHSDGSDSKAHNKHMHSRKAIKSGVCNNNLLKTFSLFFLRHKY